ncbi:hypothetical protein [Thalassobacillus sp. C254]|uniref:hypothetical protein n=1 Tax=Thalassobacillus sp. C254 TaxID=1225341 RepID=UPI0006D0A990|nr:hypothetical protein [Thalassobacillus sp. C254]
MKYPYEESHQPEENGQEYYEERMQEDYTLDERHQHYMHDMCRQYHLHFVQLQTTDGQMYDGIIEDYDNEGVTMLMPYGDDDYSHHHQDGYRQFGFGFGGGFGYPYGYGAPYGYGFPRRFRRFRRHRFPFPFLRGFFFPFFF